MARINKKDVKKPVKKVREDNLAGIKEESEKGELFFKIVLIIMAVALISVVLYFVIDAIISNNKDDGSTRYESSNYILLEDVTKVSNRDNFETLSHAGLKHTLDSFESVYIFFYSENDTNSWQPGALDAMDELMGLNSVQKITVNDFEFTIINDQTAIFFLNVDDVSNQNWESVIDVSNGQASRSAIPVLLHVLNGDDLSWYGPYDAAGQNMSAENKLNDILDTLN